MSPGNDRGCPRQEAPSKSNTDILSMSPATDEFDADAHVGHYVSRIIVEALQSATCAYWERRAEQFADALPRPGDRQGRSAPDEIERRLRSKVAACRNAAAFWRYVHTGERPRLYCPKCMTYTSPWTCSCGMTRIGGDS